MIEENEFTELRWEGRRCIVNDLSALEGRQVLRRVGTLIGIAIKAAAKAGTEAEIEVAGALGIGSVLEHIDDATVEWLTSVFVAKTVVETEAGTGSFVPLKEVQALAFAGGEGTARWGRWMVFCLQQSCGDFFADAFVQFKSAKAATKSSTMASATMGPVPSQSSAASPSPSTSPRAGGFTA